MLCCYFYKSKYSQFLSVLDSVQQHDDLKGGIQIIVIIFMINESLLENACNIVVQTNSRFHTLCSSLGAQNGI